MTNEPRITKPEITPLVEARRSAAVWSFVLRHSCFVIFLLLCGCAIGPSYKRPAIDSPVNFRSASETISNKSIADLTWWDVYKDETLKDLIQTSLTNNYDLRIAASRVEQARAIAAQTRAQFFPQIGYQGEAARGKNVALGNPNPGAQGATGSSFLALFNAAWEVDLWGRIRRLNESARAQFLASEEARRGVMLSLVADVAQAYFELLELDEELEIATHTTNSFAESLRIFSQRFEGGVSSKLETSRAEAALATTAAIVPDLERRIIIKENQINVLLGRNPGLVPRHRTLLEQALPLEVPAGLPSDLLERRPDIRQAEQLVRSANAQVGVALGDFLPRTGLTALYGGVSVDLSTITSSGANVWSVAANVAGPVFQGGRLVGRHRQSKAAWEEAKLQYQQTAMNAFQEVANALISHQKLKAVHGQQARAVGAYQEAVTVSTQRYVAGKASYYEVLEAQQQLFPAENALAETQLNQALAIVQLYKALGGGWTETLVGSSRPLRDR
jgi:multidrug efflux system outer membrane protein